MSITLIVFSDIIQFWFLIEGIMITLHLFIGDYYHPTTIFLISTFFTFSAGMIMSSFIGERILKAQLKLRKPILSELEKLNPPLLEIVKLLKDRKYPIPQVKPFIVDLPYPQLILLGPRTLIFTTGFLNLMEQSEIKAAIAKELSHFLHGDTRRRLALLGTGFCSSAARYSFNYLGSLLARVGSYSIFLLPFLYTGKIILTIAYYSDKLNCFLLQFLADSSQSIHKNTDLLVSHIGFEKELKLYLKKLANFSSTNNELTQHLFTIKPYLTHRLAELEKFSNKSPIHLSS